MKKILRQGIRHILTGGFADLIDIGVFNLLFFIFPAQIIIKAVSFLVAATIKYFGNKHWVFEKHGKEDINREVGQFLIITLVGLAINVGVFYCATIATMHLCIGAVCSANLWREISVIFALGVTAIWNFCGYKFIVFKK